MSMVKGVKSNLCRRLRRKESATRVLALLDMFVSFDFRKERRELKGF